MVNRNVFMAALGCAAMSLFAFDSADAREGRVKARGQNGVAAAGAGPNGGAFARGAGCVENQAGGQTCASGGAARTPNGSRAARASSTTVNPDGSATRRGGFAAKGANGGAVASTGATTRDADGNVSGQRETNATGAKGATYQGQVTYDSTNGLARTATCKNAEGVVVPCPRQ
jgi:hypothetical protein